MVAVAGVEGVFQADSDSMAQVAGAQAVVADGEVEAAVGVGRLPEDLFSGRGVVARGWPGRRGER
ncbi:MAG: hypothetical protein HOC74_43440 [Gemmatimonadetes bacterium]|nr:hypothetical protein [Gemmatimonadota bacterium]